MLYTDFIYKAKEQTVSQAENGAWYLEPEWQDIICRNITCELDDLNDSYLTGWYDVEDILKLEVERRNVSSSKLAEVVNWLADIISTTVDPAFQNTETDIVKLLLAQQTEKPANDSL